MTKSIKKETYKRLNSFYKKHKQEKPIKKIKGNFIEHIIYRRLLVQKFNNEYEVWDNSTDVYRPLSEKELMDLKSSDIDDFCNRLFIKNSADRINLNRKYMQIGIAKKNEKEKDYHYRIASEEIQILRKFLDINKN